MKQGRAWIIMVCVVMAGLTLTLTMDRKGRKKVAVPSKKPPRAESVKPKKSSGPIPESLRSFYIDHSDVGSIPPGIRPGYRVNILVADSLPGSSRSRVSRPILESVRVFDVSRSALRRRGKSESITGLTVLLTPCQTMILSSVLGTSELSLALCPEMKTTPVAGRSLLYTPVEGMIDFPEHWPDLREQVSPGMRTFTLTLKDTNGLSAKTRPGDRVDVIFACASSRYNPEGGNEAGGKVTRTNDKKHARIIVQDSRVLYTEQDFRPDPSDLSPVSRVVLEVNPEDAEKLAVIRDTNSKSRLRLILRHPDDHVIQPVMGCDLYEFLSCRKETARVEILRGNKTRTRSFYAEP